MFLHYFAVRAILLFSLIHLLFESLALAAPIDESLSGNRAGTGVTIPLRDGVLVNDTITSANSFSHLAKRADTSSFLDIDTLRRVVQNYGAVGRKDSLFYSGLQGQRISDIKTWYCTNIANAPNGDPYNPANPARGSVAWDALTAPGFWKSETSRLQTIQHIYGYFMGTNGDAVDPKDTVQKRTSQAFAMESSGVVYFFSSGTTQAAQFSADTAWGGWEYPSLTRNSRVQAIVQVNPSLSFTQGINPITVWRQGDPPSTQAPRGNTCTYVPGATSPRFGPCS